MRSGAVYRPGVEHDGVIFGPQVRDVCVAVADEVIVAGGNRLLKSAPVIAVQKRDPFSLNFEFAEPPVARLTGGFDHSPQLVALPIDVSEHEMRRPCSEQRHDGSRPDVAAMQDGIDLHRFQSAHGFLRISHVSVRITDDGDLHG